MAEAITVDPKTVTADARMAMKTREMGKAAWGTAEVATTPATETTEMDIGKCINDDGHVSIESVRTSESDHTMTSVTSLIGHP